MITSTKRNLTRIGKTELFGKIIKKLTLGLDLEYKEKEYILACAILFLREYEKDRRFFSYADLAYYIFLKYSLSTGDYKPLYDFSINFGFYPIAKTILSNDQVFKKTIGDYLTERRLDDFEHKDGYIETFNQNQKRKSFVEDFSFEKSYIAPTSFGKSSIILDYIRSLKESDQLKIVIVVPSKSLLMQTYKMIQRAELSYKTIIHDEMYSACDTSFIAIFTQERALRLLKKNVSFDVMIIDEAHKIFEKQRGILISRLIKRNGLLNVGQRIVYLSPLVKDVNNLKVTSKQSISNHQIDFNVKEPDFFEFKENGEIYQYNRFINKFYKVNSDKRLDFYGYIKSNAENKNFLFENNPQKIEELAKGFCETETRKGASAEEDIVNLKKILREKVHKDYFAIKYLDCGLVYIHGQLPNLVKEYLEYKFKTIAAIKYIVANTVILEGMNLPIDTIFIFGARNVSNGKSLLNLIGRVNRLDRIFSDYKLGNLSRLSPKVHIINEGNVLHDSKFKYLRCRIFDDIVKNPMLESYNIEKDGPSKSKKDERKRDKFIERTEKLQAYEKFIYSEIKSNRDNVKKYFIENSINSYYVDMELAIDLFLEKKKLVISEKQNDWKKLSMMEKIANIFIQDKDNIADYEFKRLSYASTKKYYEGYFTKVMKQSLSANIKWQVKKFNEIINNDKVDQKKVYIGKSYGDTTWDSKDWKGSKWKVYVNLLDKSPEKLLNIAIVKLQIEENFISFTLNKFIRALFDFELITEEEYNLYTYGTSETEKIILHKKGLNLNLINRLLNDGQLKNIKTDKYGNLYGNKAFLEFLKRIDDFYRFEIERYVKIC